MDKPFRLQTMWCCHPNSEKNWITKELLDATSSFEEEIRFWSKKVFW